MPARDVLYEKVFNHLKAEIQSGKYLPGDMIPTEQELMAYFGVSRMTTNRALQMLTSEGLVARKAGVGTYVLDGTQTNSSPVEFNQSLDNTNVNTATSTQALIGFVIPFLIHSFGPVLLATVEQLLRKCGLSVAIASSGGAQKSEADAIERLVDNGVQGLIVLPVNGEFHNPAILRLHVEHFPIVLVDKRLTGLPLPSVCTDNVEASRQITEYLLSLGHRHIAFFSMNLQGTSTLQDRFTGYSQALGEAGLQVIPEYCVETIKWTDSKNELDQGQIDAIAEFLREHPEVTAVFATEDGLAKYWHAAVRSMGMRVPDDFSITCFDGPGPNYFEWTYTSAIQDERSMAEHAVRLLTDLLSGKGWDHPEEVLVPAKINFGGSTQQLASHKTKSTAAAPR